MIYVLLGIIILIVSFVIALFSLVKESKNENGDHKVTTETAEDQGLAGLKQTGHDPEVGVSAGTGIGNDLLKEDKKFPWEEEMEESISIASNKGVPASEQKTEEKDLNEDSLENRQAGVISVQDMVRKQNSSN